MPLSKTGDFQSNSLALASKLAFILYCTAPTVTRETAIFVGQVLAVFIRFDLACF